MKLSLQYIVSVAAVLLASFPVFVSAHATPVSMSPQSSETVDTIPSRIIIHFSERIDPSASAVSITSPITTTSEPVSVDPSDQRILSAPLTSDGNGTYLVSWSVVSADDGHFTKGAYAFAVGKGTVISASTTASTEIIEIATTPEALAMTVELSGNGLIWAMLLLFAFAVRPLFQTGRFSTEELTVRRGYAWLLSLGIVLALSGAIFQIVVKGGDLASLRSIPFSTALPLYLSTTAGIATLARIIAVSCVLGTFLIGRKSILRASRITAYESIMMLSMCVFAFYRAKISHATANPFHPDFSIAVNFLHLIEKDVWAGIMLVLSLLALSKKMRRFLIALIPRAFQMLAIDFAAVSVTATYIVWLHLKSFDNLFTTQWGVAFLELLCAALCVVAMRIYHVAARTLVPQYFSRTLSVSFAIEFAFALLVVYYSSIVIITSPPLSQPPTAMYSAHDQGIGITFERDPYEDGMLLLTTSGGTPQTPVVTVEDRQGSAGAISIDLSGRFNGGYVFAQSLMAGQGPFRVAITVPQAKGYDAHVNFDVQKGAFDASVGWEARRTFDFFTLAMIFFAGAALVLSLALFRFTSFDAEVSFSSLRVPELTAIAAFLMTMFIGANTITSFGFSSLANPFKAECQADGNMWHLMLPTKAGVPVSQAPQEGCMWGMGNYMYMFPDKREYDYNSTLPHAIVSLDHDPLIAGKPTALVVSLKEPDGSPARLFVDMEKLVHVVIVSKDETVFAHVHPDDIRPLTKEEIDTSTFSIDYTFPKSGSYLISVDYANGLTLESKQFNVDVAGVSPQAGDPVLYPSSGIFDGYSVSLDYFQPYAGEITTLKYTITKDGTPVTNIITYLSAAMHISVVKDDFSAFIHIHGEVHPPGVPYPPLIIKNGQVIHSMAMMVLPPTLGPKIEAHLIFPSAGLYTIWGEFKVGDKVIPTSFTVRVE